MGEITTNVNWIATVVGTVVAVTAANDALLTIILVTLAIAGLIVSGGLFAQKSRYAIATEAGYIVAMVVVMIVCQGIL